MNSIDLRSEIEKDHAAQAAAEAAACAISKLPPGRDSNVFDVAPDAADAPTQLNTPLGAKCDLEGVRIETDPTPRELHPNAPWGADERDDNTTRPPIWDGTRFVEAAQLAAPNSDRPTDYRSRYPDGQIQTVELAHHTLLARSGDVPPSTDLGVPSTYRRKAQPLPLTVSTFAARTRR